MSKTISLSAKRYFNAQQKTLDARIEEVKLPDDVQSEITANHAKKFIRDKALGLFKVGEIVSEIINWNESVDEDLKLVKKELVVCRKRTGWAACGSSSSELRCQSCERPAVSSIVRGCYNSRLSDAV